jgi:hypothetical protein
MQAKKYTIIFILLIIGISILIFLNNFGSLSTYLGHCKCGGCCKGCPGDCDFAIGFPFTYYYSGQNNLSYESISEISKFGIVADIIIWITSIIVLYFLINKKSSNAKK